MRSLPRCLHPPPQDGTFTAIGGALLTCRIPRSPGFALAFTLGVAHSVGVTCVCHGSGQSIFFALKILCVLPLCPFPPSSNPCQPLIFFLPRSFTFSRKSHSWDHIQGGQKQVYSCEYAKHSLFLYYLLIIVSLSIRTTINLLLPHPVICSLFRLASFT